MKRPISSNDSQDEDDDVVDDYDKNASSKNDSNSKHCKNNVHSSRSSSSGAETENLLNLKSSPESQENINSIKLSSLRGESISAAVAHLNCTMRKREQKINRRKSDPVSLKKMKISNFENHEFDQNENFDFFNENDLDLRIIKTGEKSSRRNSIENPQKMSHFSWKHHPNHLLTGFELLLEQEIFCDVTLICGQDRENIVAHKLVLSACSDYFHSILEENPCKNSVIYLPEFSPWEMRALVEFMYRGQVHVDLDRVQELVNSGKELKVSL
jgi:hypothetical protein